MSDPEVSPARVNPGQHRPGSQLASQPAQHQRWITKFVGITNHGLVISTWKVYCGFTGFLIIKLQLALAFNTLSSNNLWSKIWYFSIGTRHKRYWHFAARWRSYWFHQLLYGIFQSMCYFFLLLCSIRINRIVPSHLQAVLGLYCIDHIEPCKPRTACMKYNTQFFLFCIL